MNDAELDELLNDCPKLYHMAEGGSWQSIRDYGLHSTSSLLTRYNVEGERRAALEKERRPDLVSLKRSGLPDVVLRDQIPMDDAGLRRCLPSEMTPSDWYQLLNSKVFFWMTKERLMRLLGAAAYRQKEHDVLQVNARELVQAYKHKIWLCPINSGCTKPFPHPRDANTFQRIGDYPYAEWRKKRKKGERVVELSIDHSVPDLVRYVERVASMRGDQEVKAKYTRS